LAALWQSWDGGLPEFFIHYMFCDEGTLAPCPQQGIIRPTACTQQVNKQIPNCPGTYPVTDSNFNTVYRCGEFTCGRLNNVIEDLTAPFFGLLSACTCEYFALRKFFFPTLFFSF